MLIQFSFPIAYVVFMGFRASIILADDPITYKADTQGVLAVAVSADGKLIVAGGVSGKVGFWDVAKRKELVAIQASEEPIFVLELSPDGKQLVTADENGVVLLWDVASHKKRAELRGHKGYVSGFSFSPDGKMLATSGYDGTVRIWSMKDLKSRELLRIRGKGFTDVAFSPDGRMLAAALFRGGVKLWKDGLAAEPVTIEADGPRGRAANCLAFSPKGDRLAVTGYFYLQLFELPSGKLIHSAEIFGSRSKDQTIYSGEGLDIEFSPDGKLLAVAVRRSVQTVIRPYFYGEILIWDAKNFRQIRVLRGHTRPVRAIVFLPDGNTLISASLDGTTRLWSMNTEKGNRKGNRKRGHSTFPLRLRLHCRQSVARRHSLFSRSCAR